MQDGCRIFGNGKSSKTTNKNQHHKFPSGLGYPKPEGKDEGESYTLFRTLPPAGGYSRNLLQLCVLFGEKKRKTPFLVIEKWGKCMQSRCCQLKTSLPFALALGLGDVD